MTANQWSALGISLWAAVLLAIMIVTAGCVTVTKKTTIIITNPITVVDMQNGDSDKEIE